MLIKAIGLTILTTTAISFAQDEVVTKHKVWVTSRSQDGVSIVARGDNSDGDNKVKIVADGETIEFDGNDLEVGESRTFDLENGKTMELTRRDEGLVMTMDGSEILLYEGGEGNGAFAHAFSVGDGSDFLALEDLETIGADDVVISGLDDLDESAREAVIKALREAGVEKEIHFSPHGIMGFGGDKFLKLMHAGGASAIFTDEGGSSVKVMNNGKTVWVEKEKEKEKN